VAPADMPLFSTVGLQVESTAPRLRRD